MGYICHHVIVVTGFREEDMTAAHTEASRIFGTAEYEGFLAPVTPVMESSTNQYYSFMVCPDGSKEGWDTSARGDVARREFRDWLRSARDRYFTWAEVDFPEDGDPGVTHHACSEEETGST